MEVRDEDPLHVSDTDPRVGESGAQRLLGLGGMETRVDEAPAMGALDQIRVDDRKTTDREGDGYAPYAGRDEIAQRAMGPRKVTLGTMEVSGPFV
jgi:hypothetical protein